MLHTNAYFQKSTARVFSNNFFLKSYNHVFIIIREKQVFESLSRV